MPVNVLEDPTAALAELLRLLGQPVRIQILLILGTADACVCHIEAVTGLRQAVISQHLMLLRNAGLVASTREGRNIFYYLANPALLGAIHQVAASAGLSADRLQQLSRKPVADCPCPRCNPSLDPDLTCRKMKKS
jgi:DNA-binding transcriptional ArsR family regulator